MHRLHSRKTAAEWRFSLGFLRPRLWISSDPASLQLFLISWSSAAHTSGKISKPSCEQCINTMKSGHTLLSPHRDAWFFRLAHPHTRTPKFTGATHTTPPFSEGSKLGVSTFSKSMELTDFDHKLGTRCMLIRTHVSHAHDHDDHKHADDSGEAGERVSRLGLLADICLTAGKGFAGYASGSTAVIADAAHSMSDVVLSGVALWIFKAARAPKDQMHPYGHGKFETLGALGISSMLLLTGGGIAWHALEVLQGLLSATDVTNLTSNIESGAEYDKLFGHEHTPGVHHQGIDKQHQGLALTATVISIGVKEGLYWITKKVGDARGSELLKANAWHHRSDAISSVIALLGVGGSMLGWHFLDPLAALLVSGLILRAGLQTGYRSLQELVDSALPEYVLSSFKETVMSVEGVKGCHAVRGRRAGSSMMYISRYKAKVDPWLSVSAAHMIGEAAREKLRGHHSTLEEIFIHIEPANAFSSSTSSNTEAESAKCNGQQMENFFQQQEIEKVVHAILHTNFEQVMAFERLRCHLLQGRLLVELEVSMEPTISVRDGILYARQAEELIMKSYPKISAVETQLRLTRYM